MVVVVVEEEERRRENLWLMVLRFEVQNTSVQTKRTNDDDIW